MLKVVDTTVRDGQQSLFATRVRTDDFLPVLEKMDEAGFYGLEAWGEAPWEAKPKEVRKKEQEPALVPLPLGGKTPARRASSQKSGASASGPGKKNAAKPAVEKKASPKGSRPAPAAPEPREHVGGDGCVRVPDVGHVVHVVDRRRYVVGLGHRKC